MKKLKVAPSTLQGNISVPPSKSQTMRAILFASLASGISRINNYLRSPDVEAMIVACRQIGATITVDDNFLTIVGNAGHPIVPDDIINAGNSGQILRFLGAVCGLISGCSIITGDASIRTNRPITELISGLKQLGASSFSTRENDYAPIVIKGPIKPGTLQIDGTLSQYVSAFIIVASFLEGETTIQVVNPGETPWVDVTLSWLDRLGIQYKNDNYLRYTICGSTENKAFNYTVPGDFTSAAYPLVASLITGSTITIHGLDMQDPQGDKNLIPALKLCGANFLYDQQSLSLQVLPSKLTGREININRFNDAITALSVLGCFSNGTTIITGAGSTRFKESNRLAAMTKELSTLGATISETDDGLTIQKTRLIGGTLNSHQDHRVALSLAVAGLGAQTDIIINDVDCIKKSYPTFVESMSALGANIEYV